MPTRRPIKKKPAAAKPAKKSANRPVAKTAPPPPASKSSKGSKQAPAAKAGKGAKPASEAASGYDVIAGLIESFATSNRITRFLIENLDENTWHAAPVGGRGRSIVAIVCHMHNARVMWLEAARNLGKAPKPPAKLDRLAATKEEALKALDQSHASIVKMVAPALKNDGKVANFKAGAAAFLSYLMTHDAHHRGQICLQAKQIGYPLPQAVGYGMWEWSKR
jgi:uncharacterized damage-inducible protein DinB